MSNFISKKLFLIIVIFYFLTLLVSGCTSSKSVFFRITPQIDQSYQHQFQQLVSIISNWDEFQSLMKCSNETVGNNFYYTLKPEYANQFDHVAIGLIFDIQNNLMLFRFTHPIRSESMSPSVNKLYVDLLRRINLEVDSNRISKLNLDTLESADSRLLLNSFMGNNTQLLCGENWG